jgi:hypothetical protein
MESMPLPVFHQTGFADSALSAKDGQMAEFRMQNEMHQSAKKENERFQSSE